jgi:hypothetical protein
MTTTIDIIHCVDGTYTVTVNGEVVAAGLLTNAAAWLEVERLVESDTGSIEDQCGERWPAVLARPIIVPPK